jgi:squalene cyclase
MIAILALTTFWSGSPEDRALAYLAREVPRWSVEHKCYSCHNNGDGARALYTAARLGKLVPPAALADTSRWLARPDGWDHNGGEGPSNDRKLARLHFTAALAAAVEAGLIKEREPLAKAAAAIADAQEKDGSWLVVEDGTLGGATTHGNALATALARRSLLRADAPRFAKAIERVDTWLRKQEVKSVLDAAAVLLALEAAGDAAAVAQRRRCLDLIRKGESKDGGWGPYVNSASEVFDTALVVLALSVQPRTEEVTAMARRGRAFLIRSQQPDGSWEETTRAGVRESYSQRLSTTGWATLALLATATK